MECIGPYSRFVHVEEEKIMALGKEVGDIEREVKRVRSKLLS